MKKSISKVLCIFIACGLLVSLTSSCSPLDSKVLVIQNDSTSAIDYVVINQYVSEAKGSSWSALDAGETIPVGGSKTFNLAPYSASISLDISDESTGSDSVYFFYDYLINGHNETITASYSGSGISVSGSNARVAQDS
ncbi:hypothetical protein [uncultured Sphaerochaeta sp.]|uniref:hypothetical protein n=1 Tax=uncultured Sphaerochaeta sp. TaxID=886478 RepID=UPI002A0A1338|nr:hypothetical protein [uncultured Sphaerochaeta sp.]